MAPQMPRVDSIAWKLCVAVHRYGPLNKEQLAAATGWTFAKTRESVHRTVCSGLLIRNGDAYSLPPLIKSQFSVLVPLSAPAGPRFLPEFKPLRVSRLWNRDNVRVGGLDFRSWPSLVGNA